MDRPRAYQEEIDQRREQERRDEALARRLQGLDIDAGFLRPGDFARTNNVGVFGIGNAAGHFLNEHFIQQVPNVVRNNRNPAQEAAANRLINEIRGTQRTDDMPRMAMPPPPPIIVPPRPSVARHSSVSTRRGANTGWGNWGARSTDERIVASDPITGTDRPHPGARVAGEPDPASAAARDERRHSALAGLTRRTTVGRVDEWRRHISGDGGAVPL